MIQLTRNEVRTLSTLQLLGHPNILQLISCYTHDSKHHLVSPYIAGGTLRHLLEQAETTDLAREDLLYSVAGLASAIWALHPVVLGDAEPSYKGNHQDLRHDNIFVDSDRLVLADFGLSSIKSMSDSTRTPFKGRNGYRQAPECVDLERLYHENETNRAADVFAPRCIITDLLVYLVYGADKIKEFRDSREFAVPPMRYCLFHRGKAPHAVVIRWLDRVAAQDGSPSVHNIVQLVKEMLETMPSERPTAATVTATLYINVITAFTERLLPQFNRLCSSARAMVEKARF